jgi:RNA polymerase sigma-70 factor (ECF subfamily)
MMACCEYRPDLARSEEAKMIRKIVAGRQDLFNDLIAPHLRPLSSMVYACIGAHPDAEDIVQQASLKAFTHLAQFRFEASFRTWLIRIGVNEVRQWRRKQVSSPLTSFAVAALTELSAVDPANSPLVECERNETVGQLRAAVARLPEKYRRVLVLRDLEDLSISEVAGRLGLTIPGVKTRHLRARRKVARLFARVRSSRPSGSAFR